ncbi:MAG TPA: acyl-CoA dehydrogenase family protein [Chondromyces sp.]|nr:acyl-CoA dehydrogenase family protein [Chondromyces sp.]
MRIRQRGGEFLLANSASEYVFTPEDLSEEQKMMQKTAKQFIEKEVNPHREEIESQNFDLIVRLLRKAGELGLLAHSVPEEYGGLGLDKVTKGIVGEIVGRTGGYGVAQSNHTCIATLPITYFGTKQQKEKYLPKLASGEYLGAYCLTEPEAGSDALSARTTAVLNEEGTHYILNGTKIFITNAVFSDTFITYAKVDGKHFTAFIVEKDFPGLSLGPEEKKMGIKGSSTRPVIYEDCLVPRENVLGEIGKGHLIALNVLNLGRFNLGFACMGGAKYALELALKYTKERKQFNTPIAQFSASKEKFANMAARIFAAESIQYRTAGLLDEVLADWTGEEGQNEVAGRLAEFALECSICKVYGSETLDIVADESLQLHGGAGFIQEYKIEQVYRDSRINRIFEGTNEINRLLLPAQLLKKAQRGEMPLEQEIQKAAHFLFSEPVLENKPLSREKQVVDLARNLFLSLLGAGIEKYGEEMAGEQELLMKLADIAIELYAMESAVLRAEKALKENEQEWLKISLTETVADQAWPKVEQYAKEIIRNVFSQEKRTQLLELLAKRASALQGGESFGRNRKVAEHLIEAEKFVC